MNIIKNNPYRQLGVYSTSTQKEVVANQGKMKAFLKVGRPVTFPLDLNGLLPDILRTEQSVANAISKLTLPAEQLRYAQFWFAKCTQLDEIACGKLTNGDIDGAIEIWNKKATASSLQNLLVCALIRNQLENAISFAQTLYSSYSNEFVKIILGENALATSDNLVHDFLNVICEESNPNQILEYITNSEWKEYVGSKSTKPIFDELASAIDVCKSSKGKGPTARLIAGTKLMNGTKANLVQLKQLISASDLQYQIIVDKLGLEILQCGIDYYNDSEAAEAAYKAMVLQKYALSIVAGKMAKDRCIENVRILEDIINKMPPIEVINSHGAIQSYLNAFTTQPDLIKYSIQLLKNCAPHIVSIKEKLGNKHQYYLKISTVIINNALSNVIAEVNGAQERDFETLKSTLIAAWRAQLYMDKFDLEPEYKEGRYRQSRDALYGIISNCKGFENSKMSFRYQYGCGWCNDLDVQDIDLQTDDELYLSCHNLSSLRTYIERFPSGKHITEAKARIEILTLQDAKTIADLEKFIKDFPNSDLLSKAQDALTKIIQEEIRNKEEVARQEKALAMCLTADVVIALYANKKLSKIDIDKCSLRAFELSKCEDDYKKVISVFGTRTLGGRKAELKLDKIKYQRKENTERLSRVLKWSLFVAIILGAIAFNLDDLGNYLDEIFYEQKGATTEYVHTNTQDRESASPYSTTEIIGDNSLEPKKSQADIDYETYIDNQLETGSKPYKDHYRSRTGDNYIDFKTSGEDYVIIVRDNHTSDVVNHIYVRANDRGRLYLPNGTYNIYFYGGKGWNPNMKNGNVVGGFVSGGYIQKDGPVELYGQYGEYTLYPVQNGNLQLQSATKSEAL